MLFLSTVALLLRLSVISAGDPCPPKSVLAPCTCTYVPIQNWTFIGQDSPSVSTAASVDLTTPLLETTTVAPAFADTGNDGFSTVLSHYTVVNCRVSRNIETLEHTISSALNRKLVDKLIIANVPPIKEHTLARLPSRDWLKKVRVRQFEVVNSKLSGDFIWNGDPLEGQAQSLLWFSAKKCSLTGALTYDTFGSVNTKGLHSLPYIQGVDFSNNYLTAITAVSFRYPPANLSSVDLSDNSIQLVEAGAFHHIPGLRYIDLSRNLLEQLYRTVFASPARRLEHIDLSWNSLTALPVDFFFNMPSLKVVNISNNFLYSMPEKPWAAAWKQFELIDLTGNFIQCNCDLMWLLPIISPPEVNDTSQIPPSFNQNQTIKGDCIKTIHPRFFSMKYELDTLTRDNLACP